MPDTDLPPSERPPPTAKPRSRYRQLSTGPLSLAVALGVAAWLLRLPSILWPQALEGGRQRAEALTGWPHVLWQLSQHTGQLGYELWIAIAVVALAAVLLAYYSTAARWAVQILAVLLTVADVALFIGTVAVIYSDALQGAGAAGR